MNILWLTPFTAKSAIGVFSREVCYELRGRGHQVRVMRTDSLPSADLLDHSGEIEVLMPDASIPPDVDLIVINYGNHAPYHAAALRIAADVPAFAIFHDAEMRHFEAGVINLHGVAIPRLASDTIPSLHIEPCPDLVNAASRPILEMLSAMSVGAIVHGPHYEPTISAACPGTVSVLPLCYPDSGTAPRRAQSSAKKSAKKMVTIFGIISPFKQPERLMRAVGQLREKGEVIDIHLAGPIEDHYQKDLVALANELGIEEPTFHGYLGDDELIRVLDDSDVICCLRHPITEGGSASLITALYRGRPLIVPDVASYSMVPMDFISKVSYGENCEDLADALCKVFDHPEDAMGRAKKAREWAVGTYSPKEYVDKLVPILDEAASNLPVYQALRQITKSAVTPDGETMDIALMSIARIARDLFFAE